LNSTAATRKFRIAAADFHRHREIVDAIERHGPPPGWSR